MENRTEGNQLSEQEARDERAKKRQNLLSILGVFGVIAVVGTFFIPTDLFEVEEEPTLFSVMTNDGVMEEYEKGGEHGEAKIENFVEQSAALVAFVETVELSKKDDIFGEDLEQFMPEDMELLLKELSMEEITNFMNQKNGFMDAVERLEKSYLKNMTNEELMVWNESFVSVVEGSAMIGSLTLPYNEEEEILFLEILDQHLFWDKKAKEENAEENLENKTGPCLDTIEGLEEQDYSAICGPDLDDLTEEVSEADLKLAAEEAYIFAEKVDALEAPHLVGMTNEELMVWNENLTEYFEKAGETGLLTQLYDKEEQTLFLEMFKEAIDLEVKKKGENVEGSL